MTHLLDTCICVALIRETSRATRDRIATHSVGDLAISAITEAELRYGADKSLDPAKNHTQLDQMFQMLPVVPFDGEAAKHYGEIRSALERSGSVIGPLDLLIGAHGRAIGVPVVTNNAREFRRIPQLAVEEW